MTYHKDLLFEIFEEHILHVRPESLCKEELIEKVVCDYLEALKTKERVPDKWIETFKEDVRVEARDIFKVLTYGFFDLKDFQASPEFQRRLKRSS